MFKKIARKGYRFIKRCLILDKWLIRNNNTSNLPLDYCFSSTFIHTNDLNVQKNWNLLHRGYEDEEKIKESIQLIRDHTMVTYDGLASLYNVVRYLEENKIQGSFIETGVCKGGSAAIMAIAAKKFGDSKRMIHLFDSFQGLPRPSLEKDYQDWMENDWGIKKEDFDGTLTATGALIATLEDAQTAVHALAKYPRDYVRYHVGWFQDTVPQAVDEIGPIALLRLDGDLYDSTMVCLQNLYPRVIDGGFIIIDDYGALKGCRDACIDFFYKQGIRPFLHYVDGTVRYFIKNE